jgi:hypothetical protein
MTRTLSGICYGSATLRRSFTAVKIRGEHCYAEAQPMGCQHDLVWSSSSVILGQYKEELSEYRGMIFRLLSIAIQGLTGKSDRDLSQTSWLNGIICVAVVAALVVFRIVWPEAARAFLNGVRFMRHVP